METINEQTWSLGGTTIYHTAIKVLNPKVHYPQKQGYHPFWCMMTKPEQIAPEGKRMPNLGGITESTF